MVCSRDSGKMYGTKGSMDSKMKVHPAIFMKTKGTKIALHYHASSVLSRFVGTAGLA